MNSSLSKSRSSAGGSSTKRKATSVSSSASGGGGGGGGAGNDLIVTRGLQEILEKDRAKKRSSLGGSRGAGGSAAGKKGAAARGTGPNFVVCYLCGRQFGSASIDIHRPQCYLKKLIEWERGDAGLRGPKPVDPETHEKQIAARVAGAGAAGGRRIGGGAKRAADLDAYNAAQFEAFNTQALAPCPNCGRTFLPDRLQVHLRSCKPGAAARPVRRGGATTPAASGGGGSDGPTPSPPLDEQPIKAAGAYHFDAAAGIDAVPPGADGTASRSPNPSQPRAASKSAPRAPSTATKVKGVSHRPSAGRAAAAAPPAAAAADSDVEIEVVEEIGEEAHPISPTNGIAGVEAVDADAESASASASVSRNARSGDSGAVSQRAALAGEAGGTSTPRRYASMEPEDDREMEFHNYVSAERESGEADPDVFTTQNAANAVEAAEEAEPPAATAAAKSDAAPRVKPQPKAVVAHTRAPATTHDPILVGADDDDGDDGDDADAVEGGSGGGKKIQLNNVSRFKNVQSRLKLDRQQQAVSLTPCQFCGRTFNPARIAKHESVCLERNKAPAPAVNRAKRAPASTTPRQRTARGPATAAKPATPASTPAAPAAAAPAAAASDATPAVSPSTTPSAFCTECGAKHASSSQKFCGSCGAKCVA